MRTVALAGACALIVQAGPPAESQFSTFPMAAGDKSEIDMVILQVAFTSATCKDHNSQCHVNGHLLKVSNPLGRFSVVPPLPGGCGSVAFVPDTAKLYNRQCIVATDAGYYNLHEDTMYDCIGNVVSQGKIHRVEQMNQSNVNFGVLKNGSFVIGYISPGDVESGIFEHLVAGLGWIVRDGKNYVKQGWEEAYTAAGSGGDEYSKMTSGRTAVGYDKDGGLIILQIDGHTHEPSWGSTMDELADKMIEFGAVQAINLDGGGSTQMWKNGEQIGYSSDRATYGATYAGLVGTYEKGCPIGLGKGNLSAFACSRAVSTILCVHEDSTGLDSFLGFASTRAAVTASGLPVLCLVAGLGCGGGLALVATKMMSKKKAGSLMENGEDDDSTE